jgi:hypothetical protein
MLKHGYVLYSCRDLPLGISNPWSRTDGHGDDGAASVSDDEPTRCGFRRTPNAELRWSSHRWWSGRGGTGLLKRVVELDKVGDLERLRRQSALHPLHSFSTKGFQKKKLLAFSAVPCQQRSLRCSSREGEKLAAAVAGSGGAGPLASGGEADKGAP